MNKNGVIAVVVVVVAIVLIGLWAMRSVQQNTSGRLDCNGAPGVPTAVSATKAGDQVTVHWTVPAGSEPVTTFVLEAGGTPGSNNQGTFVTPGTATSFTRQAPAGTYYVRMYARNACGTSPATPEIVVTVP